MLSNLYPTVIILGLLHMPISLSQDNEKVRRCGEPFRCGNIDINYPFWGGKRPEYCGHPGFEINCESDDIPNIAIESTTYRAIAIDVPTRILTLARDDLLTNICSDNNNLENASLNFNLFSYVSSDQNISLHLGCTFVSAPIPRLPNVFSCSNNLFGVYTMIGVPFDLNTVKCENQIVATINETNALTLTSTTNFTAPLDVLRTALSGGFSVNWTANLESPCERCLNSGGKCGSNSGTADFACHCATGTHPIDCNNDGNLFSTTACGSCNK